MVGDWLLVSEAHRGSPVLVAADPLHPSPSSAESWVSKGQTIKRIDIKGRARHGIKEHRQARLHVVLREGLTKAELKDKKREKVLGLIRSAGVVREEKKLINWPTNAWRW